MATSSDVMIRRVCSVFPHAFGIDVDRGTMQQTAVAEADDEPPQKKCTFTYYLDSVLGSGTYGTVLYARRVRDGVPFAVKVIDVCGYSAYDRLRAANEVSCLLSCDYFFILKCHQQYILADPLNSKSPADIQVIALVLDYANAGDLRLEIKNRSRTNRLFEEHEAGLLFIQILLAVHHVHSRHMIHRDIKSANILLCSNGLVKLGDFGFSKMYSATVSDDVGRTFCGTPYYVAPEIWSRKPYSKKADMFSLGVLLYEMLTLKRPFSGTDLNDVMHSAMIGSYEPLPDSVSSDMRGMTESLLLADPKKRPSSRKLLNTPICKLYLSVVQEIVQNGDDGNITAAQRKAIMSQIVETRRGLLTPLRPAINSNSNNNNNSNEVKGLAPVPMDLGDAGEKGWLLYGGYLAKQSSDFSWKRRFVGIYAHRSVGYSNGDADGSSEEGLCFTLGNCKYINLALLQAISYETVSTKHLLLPLTLIEDVFPVVRKYTGDEADNAFAAAMKDGKRILFDAIDEEQREVWMRLLQKLLGIGDEDDEEL